MAATRGRQRQTERLDHGVARVILAEIGFGGERPGFELMLAFGWVGPANMPTDIGKKLTDELAAVGKIPEVRTALEEVRVSRQSYRGLLTSMRLGERAAYARVIEKAGIKVPNRGCFFRCHGMCSSVSSRALLSRR